MSGLRLSGGVSPDGEPVTVDCLDGRVTAVVRGERAPAPPSDFRVLDIVGYVLMPAMAEPHAHVDKAYTADGHPNPTGDLAGAIAASQVSFASSSTADIERRARRAFAAYVAKGCLAVRSHVVIGKQVGLRSLQAVMRAAQAFEPYLDVQLVAHGGPPSTGAGGADQRALLFDAIAMGATHLGGTPYRADEPRAETATLLEIAASAGVPVDFHTDETIDPESLSVRDLAELVTDTGFTHAVTASHCVSLGVIPPAKQDEIAALLAASGVSVVSLPQTNLYLQSRDLAYAKLRGLTAIDALSAAGVVVAAGGDNVQDPFNPMGKGDPLETASLLVTAGHLDVEAAFEAVSSLARTVMGLDARGLVEGAPADLVAVPGSTLREAMAEADPRRVVVRRGVVIAEGTLGDLTPGWESVLETASV